MVQSHFFDGKTRCSFIDIARGFCILYVIAVHTISEKIPGKTFCDWTRPFTMFLFFFVAGFFFNDTLTPKAFLKKKISVLLRPFVVYDLLFVLVMIAAYLTQFSKMPIFLKTLGKTLLSPFRCVNGPLWFILAMFFACIIFYILKRYLRNETFLLIGCLLFSLIGFYVPKVHVPLYGRYYPLMFPFMLGQAFTALIFLWSGFAAKKYGILTSTPKKQFVTGASAFILYVFFNWWHFPIRTEMFCNFYDANYFVTIGAGLSGTILCLEICQFIKHFSPLEWIGRNSMMFLGLNAPITWCFFKIFPGKMFVVFFAVLLMSVILIFVCDRSFRNLEIRKWIGLSRQ